MAMMIMIMMMMMIRAITREIGRGSVSNPGVTPLDRANVREIFRPGLFLRRVNSAETRRESGFFPRIKNRPYSREKLVWCPPACLPRVSCRPSYPLCPSLSLSLSIVLTHTVSVLLAKFIRRRNDRTRSPRARTQCVACAGSMFRHFVFDSVATPRAKAHACYFAGTL